MKTARKNIEKTPFDLFRDFFTSAKAGGFILIGCTLISLFLSNSDAGSRYLDFWHLKVDLSLGPISLNYNIEHWINDGLMSIFFLLVGLEIERELYVGELSEIKNAMLPLVAAIGGMAVPAVIHSLFNAGTATSIGFGIPMATDIAFALGILSLGGSRVPVSLKIFLTALAIIDDLGAITVIALFYTKGFLLTYFLVAVGIFLALFVAGKKGIYNLPVFLIGGIIMWYCMLKSGVHASIAGVLLAFAIPFHKEDEKNPSYKLQHALHYPVSLFIIPLFALCNTAIVFPRDIGASLINRNSAGIIFGLLAGKFLGIFLVSYLAVKAKMGSLHQDLQWRHIAAIGFLGGIGFTMSIFITNLAFSDQSVIVSSKMAILAASLIAAVLGLLIIRKSNRRTLPEPPLKTN